MNFKFRFSDGVMILLLATLAMMGCSLNPRIDDDKSKKPTQSQLAVAIAAFQDLVEFHLPEVKKVFLVSESAPSNRHVMECLQLRGKSLRRDYQIDYREILETNPIYWPRRFVESKFEVEFTKSSKLEPGKLVITLTAPYFCGNFAFLVSTIRDNKKTSITTLHIYEKAEGKWERRRRITMSVE